MNNQIKKLLFAFLLILIAGISSTSADQKPQLSFKNKPRYVPGKLSVQYKPDLAKDAKTRFQNKLSFKISSAPSQLDEIHKKYGLRKLKRTFSDLETSGAKNGKSVLTAKEAAQETMTKYPKRLKRLEKSTPGNLPSTTVPPLEDFFVLEFSQDADMEKVATEYKKDPNVVSAEPMYLYSVKQIATPDPLKNRQNALPIHHFEEAWQVTQGEGITVAVVDTGFDCQHEDLIGQCLAGYDFVDIDTKAYEEADYTLDPLEDYTTPDDSPTDRYGHGTHVAGIIVANKDNGVGIAGVAPKAKLLPVRAGFRIYDKIKGYWTGALEPDDTAQAITYATDHGADVINMSFGSPIEDPQIKAALDYAHSLGVVLVAAAGNEHNDAAFSFPSSYEYVISVAATDVNHYRASFSNFGETVDVAALGDPVLSLLATNMDRTDIPANLIVNDRYVYFSGTSMASPIVSGAIALLISVHPDWDYKQILNAVRESAPVFGQGNLPNQDYYIGPGLLDANALVRLTSATRADAKIIAPISGSSFEQGTFDIVATATGTQYALSYGLGIYPTQWTDLASGLTANNQVIATVDVKNLPQGVGLLKLTTTDATGNASDTTSLTINQHLDLDLLVPFPLKNQSNVTPLIADFDQDGDTEIFLGLSVVDGVDPHAFFIVMGRDGSYKEIFNYGKGNKIAPIEIYPPAVADLDNDGKIEIVVAIRAIVYPEYFSRAILVVLHPDGTVVWQKPLYPDHTYGEDILTTPVIADLDNDGYKEVLVGTDSQLMAYNYEGTIKFHVPLPGIRYFNPPVVGNLDNDPNGLLEIAVRVKGDDKDSIHLYTADGTLRWSYNNLPPRGEIIGAPMIMANLDGNGPAELVYSVKIANGGEKFLQILNADGTERVKTISQRPIDSLAVGDIDGDQSLEIIEGDWDGNITVLKKDGSLLWSTQTPTDADFLNIADIDHDGTMDIIGGGLNVSALQSNQELTQMFALSNTGEVKWIKQIVGWANPFVITDFDKDNKLELAILPNHYPDTALYVFQLGEAGGLLYWPEYQQNSQRTGYVSILPRPADYFLRGDANNDGKVDISDGIYTLSFLFLNHKAPSCLDAADSNDDGQVDISDAITTLQFLFSHEAQIAPPFPYIGRDTTNDNLRCE